MAEANTNLYFTYINVSAYYDRERKSNVFKEYPLDKNSTPVLLTKNIHFSRVFFVY